MSRKKTCTRDLHFYTAARTAFCLREHVCAKEKYLTVLITHTFKLEQEHNTTPQPHPHLTIWIQRTLQTGSKYTHFLTTNNSLENGFFTNTILFICVLRRNRTRRERCVRLRERAGSFWWESNVLLMLTHRFNTMQCTHSLVSVTCMKSLFDIVGSRSQWGSVNLRGSPGRKNTS